jgi:membrane protein DedA with SNARE-associated domain
VNDWIVRTLRDLGSLGVGLLMLLENVVPPIPSELIMPLAGYHARRGDLSLAAAISAGSAGSLLGACAWYWLGRAWGAERVERWVRRYGYWLTVTPKEYARARDWLSTRGQWALLVTRLVPGVRTLVSLPAGAAQVPFVPFLLFSAAGTVAWTAALAAAGYALAEQHEKVGRWLGPVSAVLLGGLAVTYVVRLVNQAVGHRRRGRA